jgi:hypothetical protein
LVILIMFGEEYTLWSSSHLSGFEPKYGTQANLSCSTQLQLHGDNLKNCGASTEAKTNRAGPDLDCLHVERDQNNISTGNRLVLCWTWTWLWNTL